jgi:uncharacterized protein (DUF3820 family)
MTSTTYGYVLEQFENEQKTKFNMESIRVILKTMEMKELESRKGKLMFGKYKGKSIKKVHEFDPSYLEWIKDQSFYKKFPEIHKEVEQLLED